MRKIGTFVILGLIGSTFIVMAGDGTRKMTMINKLYVKGASYFDSSLIVNKSIGFHGSLIGTKIGLKTKVSITNIKKLGSSVTVSGNNGRCNSELSVDINKKGKLIPVIQLTDNKHNVSIQIVNGKPMIITDKVIIDLNKLRGAGVTLR